MTVINHIIEELQCVLDRQGRVKIPEKLIQEMLEMENPKELIEPILKLIESNPSVDFGNPGILVLFLESLYDCGYEELLIESVLRSPTAHNIWMLHRCYNDEKDKRHEIYRKAIEQLRASDSLSQYTRNLIDWYQWD